MQTTVKINDKYAFNIGVLSLNLFKICDNEHIDISEFDLFFDEIDLNKTMAELIIADIEHEIEMLNDSKQYLHNIDLLEQHETIYDLNEIKIVLQGHR